MKILVIGGAGYIGSAVSKLLIENKHKTYVLDDLSTGYKKFIHKKAVFFKCSINNKKKLDYIFSTHKFDAVIHLAANSLVEESFKNFNKYINNNIINGLNVLECMRKHKVKKIIFSSSAAVYGEPEKTPIKENFKLNPINPYGESKLIFERILKWYEKLYNIKYIILRYFNAAGADDICFDNHSPETHLIPNIIKAIKYKKKVQVFGNDYNTKDGTCIRDYIHIKDIADAHLKCLKLKESKIYNIGTGKGFSVLDIIKEMEKILNKKIKIKFCSRRKGDPAILVCDYSKIKKDLGWQPINSSLQNIIKSALEKMDGY